MTLIAIQLPSEEQIFGGENGIQMHCFSPAIVKCKREQVVLQKFNHATDAAGLRTKQNYYRHM